MLRLRKHVACKDTAHNGDTFLIAVTNIFHTDQLATTDTTGLNNKVTVLLPFCYKLQKQQPAHIFETFLILLFFSMVWIKYKL